MIQLADAGKRFGPKVLFEELDWLITPRDRVGLVGANGTGKSTLLKVLAGLDSLDYGKMNSAKDITRGYLPQDDLSLSGRTVFEEGMAVFGDLLDMEREMEALTHSMAELDPEGGEYHRVAERHQRLDSQFNARDGYALESKVGAVLGGLGFPRSDWARSTEEFSGGWQMRLALAKLLLQEPNLLLLDEPTNHLDLEARNWLEDYLSSYPNAIVLVSHDRYFLDVTVSKIVEIWNYRVHFYSGNYDQYLAQKKSGEVSLRPPSETSSKKSNNLRHSSTGFATRRPKRSRCKAASRKSSAWKRSNCRWKKKPSISLFPSPKPAAGRWQNSAMWPKGTMANSFSKA